MTENFNEKPAPTWEDYWSILRRRRWWLIVPAFFTWAMVVGASWTLPSRYRSETVILVEQPRVPKEYVVPNVVADLQERLQSMTEQILSRTRLERIIDQFDLYRKGRSRLGPDELVARMRKDIEIELVQAPGGKRELTAFKIYYSANTPHLAQQVISQVTSFFIEENLRSRQQQSEQTTNFLDNQLVEARQRLELQEKQLRDFKGRHLGQLPGQLQGNIQILAGLQARLQDANERLNRAEQQKLYFSSLASQYRAISAKIQPGPSPTPNLPTTLDQQIDQLTAQAAELRAKYTEKHPDVVRIQEQIAKAEKRKKQMEAQAAPGEQSKPALKPGDLRDMAPIWEIEGQLKASELEIQNRKQEISALQAELDNYQARVNLSPLREQQLADINRDYDQSRTNYESLLMKRNQSELATNLEKQQQGEQFRIIDPPSLPSKPISPNRLLFSLVGLAAGLALGGAVVAGAELIDDRVHKEKELEELAPLAIVAEIPALATPGDVRNRRHLAWMEAACGAFMMTVVAGVTLVAYYRG